MGAIVDSILSGLTKLVMNILNPVFSWIMEYVVGPIMTLIMSLIMWSISLMLYSISCFLLGLVDFVEMLFRLLAGLPTDGIRLTIRDSTSDSPDLLVQIIQSDIVQQTFLSMCIVGLFLLLITTIFQMIRVEYTSEGAKNAKGPILEKAFKAICNLMLVPIVTIFGIYLGNSVLDLLDTATKGESNASISGALFMAAAGDAFYEKPAFTGMYAVYMPSPAGVPITAVFDAVMDALQQGGAVESEYVLDENERYEIEQKFLTGEVKYFDIIYVSSYFVMADINYLVLLFGSCFAIKCLWHAAFGMVSRLYYCIVYFIIAPIVMGMSVIKDNVASWRSKFMGKALSAYGVVLALNIFFIVVRVLLRVEIDFNTTWENGGAMFFEPTTMTMLLKGVFVLSGCVMIEKFSGELGTYFGAEDGLATGKALANDVGKEATKGVKLATQAAMVVGSGGVGMAAKGALSSVGGVASKIGKPVGGMLQNTVGGVKKWGQNIATTFTGGRSKEERQQMRDARKDNRAQRRKISSQNRALRATYADEERFGIVDPESEAGKTLKRSRAARKGHITKAKNQIAANKETMSAIRDEHKGERLGAILDSTAVGSVLHSAGKGIGRGVGKLFGRAKSKTDGTAEKVEPTKTEGIADEVSEETPSKSVSTAPVKKSTTTTPADSETPKSENTGSAPKDGSSSVTHSKSASGGNQIDVHGGATINADKTDEDKKGDSDADKKRRLAEDRAAYNQEAAFQMGKSWMDSLLSKTPLQGILDADKSWNEGAKKGLGASDTGKQILSNIEKDEQEKAGAALDARHAAYKSKREKEMTEILANELSKGFKQIGEEIKKTADDLRNIISEARNKTGRFAGITDDAYLNQQIAAAQNKLNEMEISGQLKLDLDANKFADAIADAMKGGSDTKAIQEAIAKQFEKLGKDSNKELLKKVEEVIQKTMQDLGK